MSKRKPTENEELKNQAIFNNRETSEGTHLTTSTGVKISDTDNSLKAGERGPTIMDDFHFREKMTHFDHERIPERVVHARGSGAHGYYQVYEPLTDLTAAKIFADPSKQTPVFVRFSTVVGFRGSADTVRDVRGFATKFYTDDGNWDLVGNNMPVFFIQDGIKFPDLVHAIKPEPHNEMPQASAAHDNFWDFISLMPESMNMIMWVMSDRALPRSYSMMEGFGVHTFRLINAKGKSRFVKFHWKPLNGVHSLVWDETQKIAGKDPDFNRRDLWNMIEKGNYPEYELGIQILEEEQEFDFDFDILDPTKIIPEELVPVRKVGKMILNRNPDNFFAETEQVAFHPGHIVPGIDFTNDPLLQARLFSYVDTQLIRLGGPNFNEIAINRPMVQVHNNQRDGYMRQTINRGRTNYFPNSLGGGYPATASREAGGFVHHMEKVEGHKIRVRSDSFKDYFSQAKLFYNSMSEPEKKHIVEAFHFELGKVETKEIRQRMVYMIANVDVNLAKEVAKGIGVEDVENETGIKEAAKDAIPPSKGRKSIDHSPALSQENLRGTSIKGRKIAILVDHGFDYQSVKSLQVMLNKKGAMAEIVSKFHGKIKSESGDTLQTDKSHVTTGSIMYDALFIPGGTHVELLKKQGDVLHFINEAYKHCKPIGLTAEAIELLKISSVEFDNTSFAEGGAVHENMGIVTAWKNENIEDFLIQFERAISQHRHWGRAANKEMVPA